MTLRYAHGFWLAILICLVGATNVQAQPPFGGLPDVALPPTEDDGDDDDVDDILGDDGPRPRSPRVRPIQPYDRPEDGDEDPDQPFQVDTRYAGWEGAGAGGENGQVSEEIRSNWIMVDSNGRFEGRVVPMDNAVLGDMAIFLLNRGRLVKQEFVDENGMYEFKGVRQGSYALIGWSDGAFFAFGLNILANTEDSNPQIPNRVTTLAFQNRTTINTDWIKYYAPQVGYRVFGSYPEGEGANDSEALYGFIGLVENQPDAVPATSISGHNVAKTPDGRVVGRVHQLTSESGRPVDVRSTKVLLLQNDGVFASTTTDNFGVFEFSDVPTGRYAVMAAGPDGVGLIGMNVVDNSEPLMDENGELSDGDEFDESQLFDFTLLSSETTGWLNHYATEVAYRRVLLSPRRPLPENNLARLNNEDRNPYDGFCKARTTTFRQWTAQCRGPYCQDRASKPEGFIRRAFDGLDDNLEKAFYPPGGDGISGGLQGGVGTQLPAAGPQQGIGPQGAGFQGAGFQAPPQPVFAPQGSGTR
ncbi:carboxypeptidase-like regulatory domain-containing protein [Mariniblastus sp.]|nr:carboxypeptidase-like regulatory domain-containing protein [Mariniblastus sp.]